MSEVRLLHGDCLQEMASLPSGSVDAIVTSPPYLGLRAYLPDGHADKSLEMGLEDTPAAYVARLVGVFEDARRVLRDDGTLWLNLGDSYASAGYSNHNESSGYNAAQREEGGRQSHNHAARRAAGLKPKDLYGIPWRVAFALQEAGWWLRSDIIWHKPNPMPESVTDRPTKAHEYIFLLAKSSRYYYDADAIKEPSCEPNRKRGDAIGHTQRKLSNRPVDRIVKQVETRNARTVWTQSTRPFRGAHFATFPPDLIRPCIRAGCRPGGTVLDPFFGAGTTGVVCVQEGRNCIGIELNDDYLNLASARIANEQAILHPIIH